MTTSTQWRLAGDAAERYETILVPTILGPFAKALVDFAEIRPGDVVLDVGCGTGAASRFAATCAGAAGRVVGVDINAGMLAAAKSRHAPEGSAPLDWREADASKLPVDDASADVVLCAQTIQFLSERTPALREMHRAVKPTGRVVVSVWRALDENPYFEGLVRAVERHIGHDTANGLRAAFSLTDADAIQSLVAGAGFRDITVETLSLELDLPPLSVFVPSHIAATPMAKGYADATDEARAAVVRDVIEAVGAFAPTTTPRIPYRSHVVSSRSAPIPS